MARLVLSRSTALTLPECEALPAGTRVDNGPHGGRAELELAGRDLAALIDAAVALGRAVPDGKLDCHDLPDLTAPPPPRPTTTAPSDPSQTGAETLPAAPLPATPWELLDEGQIEPALAGFALNGLDSDGRTVVRRMVDSTDPAQVALACRIAAAAQWKSFVTQMRRLLQHGDVRVREQAVRAIGVMGGPSVGWHIEKLGKDPSPDVRAAVTDALAAIEARQ